MGQEEIAKHHQNIILGHLLTGPKDWKTLKKLTKLSDRTLAKHIKRLEESGFIESEIDKRDRRKKIYKISLGQIMKKMLDETLELYYLNKIGSIYKDIKSDVEFYSKLYMLFIYASLKGEQHLSAFLKALKVFGRGISVSETIVNKEHMERILKFIEKELQIKNIEELKFQEVFEKTVSDFEKDILIFLYLLIGDKSSVLKEFPELEEQLKNLPDTKIRKVIEELLKVILEEFPLMSGITMSSDKIKSLIQMLKSKKR